MCVLVGACTYLWGPEECVRFPGAVVTSGCVRTGAVPETELGSSVGIVRALDG